MELNNQLIKIADVLGAKFNLNNKPISHSQVFADTGLLPAIARRADQLCSLCFGYGIGVSFEEAEKSILGVRVVFDETTPTVLRLMCIADALNEIVQNSSDPNSTALDELMYD